MAQAGPFWTRECSCAPIVIYVQVQHIVYLEFPHTSDTYNTLMWSLLHIHFICFLFSQLVSHVYTPDVLLKKQRLVNKKKINYRRHKLSLPQTLLYTSVTHVSLWVATVLSYISAIPFSKTTIEYLNQRHRNCSCPHSVCKQSIKIICRVSIFLFEFCSDFDERSMGMYWVLTVNIKLRGEYGRVANVHDACSD